MEKDNKSEVNEYTLTLRQKHTDAELKEMNWKRCITCKELRSEDLFYKTGGTSKYTCKICHRKKVRSYRNIPDSYNWWYRRLERKRKSALKRGLEFTLKVEDFKDIKEAGICEYCKSEIENITIERIDNDKGYIKDNVIPVCYTCNKIKGSFPLNLVEMHIIGRAVRKMNERLNRNPDTQYRDEKLIVDVLLDKRF